MNQKFTYVSVLLLALLLSACNRDFFIPPDAPAAPTGLTVTPSDSAITLRWQDNSTDETGFAIYRQAMPTSAGLSAQQTDDLAVIGNVAADTTEYEDKAVVPGTLYRYGVAAKGRGKPSSLSTAEGLLPEPTANRAPSADAQKVSTQENKPVAVTLTGSDADGDALTYEVVTAPKNGSLSGTAPKLTYTPNANYSGADSFTFTVSDGQATSAAATVTLSIGNVNDAPVANPQTRSTPEDTPLTLTLTGSDQDGDTLTFAIVTQPSKGSLGSITQATGKVTYTPNPNATGQDSFTFTVSDGKLTSAPATVTVNLGVVNDAPVAASLTLSTTEDTDLSITLSASDDDGGTLTYTVIELPSHGGLTGIDTVSKQVTGTLSYKPNADFNGTDSFTFKANDGFDDSNVATVNITVDAVNDAPTAVTLDDDSVEENQPAGTVVGTLSAADVDSSSFTYSLVIGTGDADNASFTVDGDKLKTAASFDSETKNEYSVRVQVSDGDKTFAKSFTITVNDVDDTAPSVTLNDPGALTVAEEITLSGSTSDNVGVTQVEIFEGTNSKGTATLSDSDDTWSYAYTPEEAGSFTLKVVAKDAAGNTKEATQSVTVTAQLFPVQFGTSGADFGKGVASDSSNNIYVVGSTNGNLAGNAGSYDAVLAKYNSNGTQQWVKQFGTSATDVATSVATDSSGNVYVSGYTTGNLDGTNQGSEDAFIAKYDAAGTQQWVRQFGANGADYGNGVATDSSGNIYVGGNTQGGLATNLGSSDAFIAKYDSSGTQQWVKQFGTNRNDGGTSVATDSADNVYVGGYAYTTGDTNALIAKFDSNGVQQWSEEFDTDDLYEEINGVATDSSNDVYLTGRVSSAGNDIYLVKYDSGGTQQWKKQIDGRGGSDVGYGIAIDSSDNLYVGGETSSSFSGTTSAGGYDAFVAKYDSSGTEQWVRQFGSNANDHGRAIAVNSGGVYITGEARGRIADATYSGDADIFIAKYDGDGTLP